MSRLKPCKAHDERGASLMLVIAFMILMGTISAAVLSTATSGIQQRVALDQTRNRQYSADAGVETEIARARFLSGTCAAPPASPYVFNANIKIHVDCSSAPATVVGPDGIPKLQDDLSFSACLASGSGYGVPCTPATAIIDAQVNYQGTAPTVTTYVQAWSVNG